MRDIFLNVNVVSDGKQFMAFRAKFDTDGNGGRTSESYSVGDDEGTSTPETGGGATPRDRYGGGSTSRNGYRRHDGASVYDRGHHIGSDPRGMRSYIRRQAALHGVNPDVAVRVAEHEGLGTFLGDHGKSGGAFQLYTGGGLGNKFQKETGLNPLDPKNERESIRWAMAYVGKTKDWSPWHGAPHAGVGAHEGFGYRGGVPAEDAHGSQKGMLGKGTTPGTPLGDATHHPGRYQGTMTIDGKTFDYASGGHGRGSSPFGEHPITGFDRTALHGRGGGAFRTQDVYDPKTGDKRGAVEIHMSNQDTIDKVGTAGCYGIPASQWPEAKTTLKNYLQNHPEGATLRVHPDGRAEVVSRNAPAGESRQAAEPKRGLADVAEGTLGLHDRDEGGRKQIQEYLRTGGHGMNPTVANWCASWLSASLRHAGHPDIPQAKGGDVATSYMNYGTAVKPGDVQRGDIMIGGTQGHKPGQIGGHVAIVSGSASGGRIPIVEGDQRDNMASYATSPGSVHSTAKTGPAYTGGHSIGRNTVGMDDEGLMFRRPPQK